MKIHLIREMAYLKPVGILGFLRGTLSVQNIAPAVEYQAGAVIE